MMCPHPEKYDRGDCCGGLCPDPLSDAAVEAVARAFCKHMGLDPDVWYRPGDKDQREEWRRHAHKARKAIAMHLALKEVLE